MSLHGLRLAYPCNEGKRFLQQHKTAQAAWDACDRLDWMLWYLSRSLTRKEYERVRLLMRYLSFQPIVQVGAIRALYPTPPPLQAKYRRRKAA